MSRVILITGVSSGFGRETSRLLAAKGYTVYGTVRSDTMAPDGVKVLQMDLTDCESINRTVDTLLASEGRLDILINNAGMHTGGAVENTPEENFRLQMETNFTGVVNLTKKVLPVMRGQGGGLIINISSIGGLMGLPFQAFYSASKFAIEGFSEALRMEVRGFNIKVVVINPGDFHTSNSANRRKYLAPSEEGDVYADNFKRALSVIERDEAAGWDPEILARRIVRIVGWRNPGQRYVIGSFEQRLAVVLKRILPGSWFRKILESHYTV